MTAEAIGKTERHDPGVVGAWGWFVGLGAVLAALGFIASANLVLATVAAIYLVGAVMLAGGVVMLVHAFGVRRWQWVAFWTVAGLLYLVAAVLVIYDPLFAAQWLTLLMGLFLGASGIVRTFVALRWRGSGWGWMLASGLASIILAVLIILGWPFNILWVLGLILAIDLLFQGLMLMLIGFSLRSRATRTKHSHEEVRSTTNGAEAG